MSREELLQRGYCCGLGCKECPYYPKHQFFSTSVAEVTTKETELDKQNDSL